MDSKAEEEGVLMTKTTVTTTSLSMPSAKAKIGLHVEDLWDVQAPQLNPADKLNTCFEEIPMFSFPRASFSSVEIDSESSLVEAVRVLAKHMLLSAPVVDAHAPKDASWVDRYIGVVEFVGIIVWILQQVNFMVPVDFTASNGNPRLPDSLHYIDPSGRPNAYQKAILDIAGVLQFYDSDKHFHAWGFGARPIDGPVSHCFNLNGSSNYCEVEGIQGIMMSYLSALMNVSLAGPTLFGPIISTTASIASQTLIDGSQKYYVLLIIMDGVIIDLQETKDAFVKASNLPLSILIVGVGGADFKEMEVLDGNKGERLESTSGRIASCDIVQFVPFRDVQGGEISVSVKHSV